MKKTIYAFCFLFLSIMAFASGQQEMSTTSESPESSATMEKKVLNILCYDSFASEWGPGPALVEQFTAKTGIEVQLNAPGDAVMILTRAIMEKDDPTADLIIGPDNNLLARTLNEGILQPYDAPALAEISSELKFDSSNHLLPFDWGYFAICYDSEVLSNPPSSLEDLTKPEYAKSLVLMDPRTSSPGMGFLLWTRAVYGEDYLDYWNRLAPSVLTVTESWSSGYGLFTSGEAPLVLSYSTSPVYHKMWEESERYKALNFAEGNYLQVEGVGIIKGAAHPDAARQFIDFMLSPEGQLIIATNNIMMPAVTSTELPEAFDMAFYSENPLLLDKEEISKGEEEWVQSWVEKSGL
ncbi:thiamine ABC transporter substrate-binding protein [Oceanispirochaeta crateris]|uniref:Thiamine ABC transporter substrate-binding protein n=1 Tax=Oceanispirochaeta crateris TaxID=2518645 RepID=A0A5C1QNS7_9SPIO|nr:thiamine ABC transporter substrate binding subunit [Oceanispirochaeta crateris]QEN08630.1 thiamine ABC transporter substrate-binding protein [Oceanispirochaeta crateris]